MEESQVENIPGGANEDTSERPLDLNGFENRQEEARQYHKRGRVVGIIRTLLGFLFLAAILFFGLSKTLALWAHSLTGDPWLGLAVFGAVLFFGYEILTFPLDLYSGHRLPKTFGLSRQAFAQWLMDSLKSTLIGFLLSLLVFEVFYWLLRTTTLSVFPLWAGLGFLAFLMLGSWLAPVVLMPVFFKTEPVDDEDLERQLFDLARDAGTEIRGVFQFDLGRKSRTATAALTGLGKTRRVLLSDTLLFSFTCDETAVVLAHELAHHKKRHIPKMIAAQAVLGTGVLYAVTYALQALAPFFRLESPADMAGLPVVLLILGGAGLIGAPLARSVSRRMETGCDDYALRATGNPDAFISAMRKLSALNLAEESPSPWVERLFHSHPSISRRIKRAERFREGLSAALG